MGLSGVSVGAYAEPRRSSAYDAEFAAVLYCSLRHKNWTGSFSSVLRCLVGRWPLADVASRRNIAMTVYFVHRSHETPALNRLKKFKEATLLQWFQKHWKPLKDENNEDVE